MRIKYGVFFILAVLLLAGCANIGDQNETTTEETLKMAEVEENVGESLFSVIKMANEREYDTGNEILELSQEKIVLAPYNYTADDKDLFTDQIEEYDLAEDVEYYIITENAVNRDGVETQLNISCSESSYEDMLANLEYGIWAYVWFNEDEQVSMIVTHGKTTVYE